MFLLLHMQVTDSDGYCPGYQCICFSAQMFPTVMNHICVSWLVCTLMLHATSASRPRSHGLREDARHKSRKGRGTLNVPQSREQRSLLVDSTRDALPVLATPERSRTSRSRESRPMIHESTDYMDAPPPTPCTADAASALLGLSNSNQTVDTPDSLTEFPAGFESAFAETLVSLSEESGTKRKYVSESSGSSEETSDDEEQEWDEIDFGDKLEARRYTQVKKPIQQTKRVARGTSKRKSSSETRNNITSSKRIKAWNTKMTPFSTRTSLNPKSHLDRPLRTYPVPTRRFFIQNGRFVQPSEVVPQRHTATPPVFNWPASSCGPDCYCLKCRPRRLCEGEEIMNRSSARFSTLQERQTTPPPPLFSSKCRCRRSRAPQSHSGHDLVQSSPAPQHIHSSSTSFIPSAPQTEMPPPPPRACMTRDPRTRHISQDERVSPRQENSPPVFLAIPASSVSYYYAYPTTGSVLSLSTQPVPSGPSSAATTYATSISVGSQPGSSASSGSSTSSSQPPQFTPYTSCGGDKVAIIDAMIAKLTEILTIPQLSHS